jgi:hypothetical protein
MAAHWSFVLVPLALGAIVALLGSLGCGLDDSGGWTDTPNPDSVSYWLLGEASGTTAGDSVDGNPGQYEWVTLLSASQSPATVSPGVITLGAPGLLEGQPSETCIRVDGGYVEVPYAAALNTPEFTVMAWAFPEFDLTETVSGQKAFRCVLASREGNGVQPRGYMIYSGPDLGNPSDTTLYWQAWVGDGTSGGAWAMLIGPPVEAAQTTHLALTYDGTTLKLYVNGSDDTTGTPDAQMAAGFSPNTSKSLFIGMGAPDAPSPLYPFKGRLQDVRYFKSAQPASEIDNILWTGLGGL